jgi:hypothetical protein
MGLLSFLFGGGKKEKPKTAPKSAAKTIETKLAEAAKAVVAPLSNRPRPRAGVVALRLDYAAKLRTGDPAAAYGAACKLAGFYRKSGASALAAEYRAAATKQLSLMLVRAAKGRAAKLAAVRAIPTRARLADAAQAKLVAAHRQWLAKLERRAA